MPAPFFADLHIHSRHSRATSRDCDLEHLAWWGARKGIGVVGTGDFTHPGWWEELESGLVPAEPGLFRLQPDVERAVLDRLPASCRRPVRFMLSVEISTIYKFGDRTRKVHHLVYAPDFDTAQRFNERLGQVGNLRSDGRPILGLDSRHLLEIALESGDGAYLVPAHVWTPWFSVLGSKSGFDSVAECYRDLAHHIFAVETGLSSDPPMNWRVSGLDRYRLVSNSDAHSPPILGREACAFNTELDYFAIRRALETGDGYEGTVEFFPEEGKYHLDGHRNCGVRWEPTETRRRGAICTGCGKEVTVGVMHRVEELADRGEDVTPERAAPFRSLVPLPEIIGEIRGMGPKTKTVERDVVALVDRLGPELGILEQVPLDTIAAATSELVTEAVERLRRGQVVRDAGYDGEYGVIRMFEPGELAGAHDGGRGAALFDLPPPAPVQTAPAPVKAIAPPLPRLEAAVVEAVAELSGLDPEQQAAVSVVEGPVLVVAGPGTGKTRVLTHRVAHLISRGIAAPDEVLAVTFTRRAAEEMQERLCVLVPEHAARVTVATFHGLGLRILREQHEAAGLPEGFRVADEPAAHDPTNRAVTLDELLRRPVELLESNPELVAHYRSRWRWLAVDEYQDVDDVQYRLVRLLAPPDGNVCVIGDPDQAIYGFRGADVGFFLRFQHDFPGAHVVQLARNYRSSPAIVKGAMQAIASGSLVADRTLEAVSKLGAPGQITIHEATSERAEAEFVVKTIDELLGGFSLFSFDSGRVDGHDAVRDLSFADVAILFRTDAQAEPIAEALERSGIPFRRRSHDRLVARPGVGPVVDALRRSPAAGTPVKGVVASVTDDNEVLALLEPLAERCGSDLDRFLTELALGAEVDSWDPRADSLSLLTLHASKGLEFEVVFIVGCEDGLVPLRFGGGAGAGAGPDPDEERRLLFVGMTRARSRLYLSHARRRLWRGQVRDRQPSPFLADIEEMLLHRQRHEVAARRRQEVTQLKLL